MEAWIDAQPETAGCPPWLTLVMETWVRLNEFAFPKYVEWIKDQKYFSVNIMIH